MAPVQPRTLRRAEAAICFVHLVKTPAKPCALATRENRKVDEALDDLPQTFEERNDRSGASGKYESVENAGIDIENDDGRRGYG